MHKLNLLAYVTCITLISIIFSCPLKAISGSLMISQVKIGNSSTSRLVEVYNNSAESVDITGWCLHYHSPTDVFVSPALGCFNGTSSAYHQFIAAKSHILLTSIQTGLGSDISLVPGLGSGSGGHVYLYDGNGVEIDRVGWGTASNPETKPIIPDALKIIERKTDSSLGVMVDTDNNEADFFNSVLRTQYDYGLIYEVVDICVNIPGIQHTLPEGYMLDDNGSCMPPPVDVCLNLDGMQISLPVGYELDGEGNCMKDICLNLAGLQSTIPTGYKLKNDSECAVDLLPLSITEVLPNAKGDDDGREFIEIFNPNDVSISLGYYVLHIDNSGRDYYFPAGSIIEPRQYLSFSNGDIQYTLANTSSGVGLYSIDGELIDDILAYEKPKDDAAWALINGAWQYTDIPTPGFPNKSSTVRSKKIKSTISKLVPCAPNQYRNPATNRCKLIESSTTRLVPCKEGQYRSEETNRCRSIAAVLAASTLKPCKPGQERNPETNRCRNIIKSVPSVDYAPEQNENRNYSPIMLWSLGGLGVAAASYGIWEWRREIIAVFKK